MVKIFMAFLLQSKNMCLLLKVSETAYKLQKLSYIVFFHFLILLFFILVFLFLLFLFNFLLLAFVFVFFSLVHSFYFISFFETKPNENQVVES